MDSKVSIDVPAEQVWEKGINEIVDHYVEKVFNFDFDPKNPVVKLHEPSYGAEEINAAISVMLSTNVTLGKSGYVEEFEKEFAKKYGFKYAVMVNSGSSANLLAVSVLTSPSIRKLKPGDKVIVPALCWSTTIWPLIQNGLIPVIVDISFETLNIDFNRIDNKILKEAKGIIIVHVYGNPCEEIYVNDFCRIFDLVLIEDCCEALGSRYGNRSVGTNGEISTFSFYFSHHMTTFEGGMCVTSDEHLYNHLKIMRSHGWRRDVLEWIEYPDIDPKFTFVDLGYNFRPTEIQGAVGLEQLKKVDNFIRIRNDNYIYWYNRLEIYNGILQLQNTNYSSSFNSSFGFTCIVNENAKFTVSEIREFLEEHNIETRAIICGNIAKQPALKSYNYIAENCPNADRVMKNGFSWGNHQHIRKGARQYVACVIDMFMANKGYSNG